MALLRYCVVGLLSYWIIGVPVFAQAQSVSSAELIQNAQQYDGEQLIYEGEVIGELMQRRDGVWANINDGQWSIGVWMSSELAAVIEYKGSYKAKGDIIQAKGIFNRACIMHGGDLDIHAVSLNKIKSGWQRQEKIIPAKLNLLITLSILLVLLCLILILKRLITR